MVQHARGGGGGDGGVLPPNRPRTLRNLRLAMQDVWSPSCLQHSRKFRYWLRRRDFSKLVLPVEPNVRLHCMQALTMPEIVVIESVRSSDTDDRTARGCDDASK